MSGAEKDITEIRIKRNATGCIGYINSPDEMNVFQLGDGADIVELVRKLISNLPALEHDPDNEDLLVIRKVRLADSSDKLLDYVASSEERRGVSAEFLEAVKAEIKKVRIDIVFV